MSEVTAHRGVVGARALGPMLLLTGSVLLFWPAASTRVLASLVGVGAVVFGIRELTRSFGGEVPRIDFTATLLGLVSVFGGVVIVLTPTVSDTASSTVIGVYWLIAGALEVAGALLRPAARLERLLLGVISLAAGVLVLVLPDVSLVVFVWFAGGWLLAAGAIVLMVGSMRADERRALA